MSTQPLICSANSTIINKTADWQEESKHWVPFVGTPAQLVAYIRKGHALNQSRFRDNQTRSNGAAYGGNLVVLDLDEGISFDDIIGTATYKEHGVFVYPSASCGVVAEKDKVDGRERWRVGFRLGREVSTLPYFNEAGERLTQKRVHLERIAVTNHLTDRFCSELGITKLEDNCHKTVSQIFYGNDGVTPITYETETINDDGSKTSVTKSYQCSTEERIHINDGVLPAADMDAVIEAYTLSHPEIFEPIKLRSDDELSRDIKVAQWILEMDLLSEDQLTDRDIAIKQVVACAKGLGEELLDPFLGTMERVDDGHPWRIQHQLVRAWESYSEHSSFTIATLVYLANEASPGWQSECPYMCSSARRYPAPRLSECFTLLRSTNPLDILI